MPCVYDDVPGSWRQQSDGWPSIADPDEKVRHLVIKKDLVPYGSYVTVDGCLRLETQDYVKLVSKALNKVRGKK